MKDTMLIYSISYKGKLLYIGQTRYTLKRRISNYKRSIATGKTYKNYYYKLEDIV